MSQIPKSSELLSHAAYATYSNASWKSNDPSINPMPVIPSFKDKHDLENYAWYHGLTLSQAALEFKVKQDVMQNFWVHQAALKIPGIKIPHLVFACPAQLEAYAKSHNISASEAALAFLIKIKDTNDNPSSAAGSEGQAQGEFFP